MEMDAYTDDQLVALLRQGESAAFDQVYERYWHDLYQTAFRRLADREQSSDIVQDVFTDLWAQRTTKSIGQLLPYLHTAVRYKVYSYLAKGKRLPALVEPFEHMLTSPLTADGPFKEAELKRLMEAWLDTLPTKRRLIFERHYLQGKSTQEIAEEFGISQKTVQNQLHTASTNLRALIVKTVILGMWLVN